MLCPDCEKKCAAKVCLKCKLNDVRLELLTSKTMGVDDQPLYKWAAAIICDSIRLQRELNLANENMCVPECGDRVQKLFKENYLLKIRLNLANEMYPDEMRFVQNTIETVEELKF